jgi:hypothetical protein
VNGWNAHLVTDPLPRLLASQDAALGYSVRRNLLSSGDGPAEELWELPEARAILRRQQTNGSWRYPGQQRKLCPEISYDLLETFRRLAHLVERFGFDRRHPSVERAAEYMFSCQTEEGDIRGILGTQYMPYYHGVLLELLVRAGYVEDPRVEKGTRWLLSMRQDDGGWLVPLQAVPAREKTREMWTAPPVPPDRPRPSSHLATGMALRAFALQPRTHSLPEVRQAAARLKSCFFRADRYNDRKAPIYWIKFQHPFWWPNLLTALDTLSLLGFPADDPDVQKGLAWFRDNQRPDGLWRTGYEQAGRAAPSPKEERAVEWVALAVCRVLKRFWP